jgi:hypothetical protein
MNISSIFYMLTPVTAGLSEIATATGGDAVAVMEMMDQMSMDEIMSLTSSLIPVLVIWILLFTALLIPLLYRFRMAEYVILENKGIRGMGAMILSAGLLRRRCWQLFKLDLRFWWYYGLKLLCMLLLYGDLLLPMLGVALPVGGDAVYLVFNALYLLGLFCVETLFRPRVDTAYAAAYDAAMEMGPVPRKMQTPPANVPWDEA